MARVKKNKPNEEQVPVLRYEPPGPDDRKDTFYFRAAYRDPATNDHVTYEVFVHDSVCNAMDYAKSLHPNLELLYVSNFPTATDAMTY